MRASVKTILCSTLLFCLAFASPLLADDVITNVVSPIVSYQFPDDSSSQALTNGGIISPIVSYQYFEWPGNDVLQLLSSPQVSYFFQIGNEAAPIVLSGQVTQTGGGAVSGAIIKVSVGRTAVAQTTTDSGGHFQLPPLGAGVYVLSASAVGHQNSVRTLTLSAATAQQDFQLAVSPSVPTVQQTSRQPPSSFTLIPVGPLGSTLKVFDGTAFVAITPGNAPSPNLMTIVLTHGWVPEVLGYEFPGGVESWPTDTARLLHANGVGANVANILGWDWRYGAEGALPPEENTPSQGVALGKALQAALGAGYATNLHLIGSSLGTLVNAAAANYLHGDRTATERQEVAPTPWLPSRTHVTLFDQAEIARVAGVQVLFDGLTTDVGSPVGAVKVASKALQGWKPSSPVQFAWMDNYISLFGFYNPAAVNVALQKAEGYAVLNAHLTWTDWWKLPFSVLADAHGYPIGWYGMSITNPADCILGFQRSREYLLAKGQPGNGFPPAADVFAPGSRYHQVPGADDQLALEPLPLENLLQTFVPLFGNGADAIVEGVVGPVQIAGQVLAGIADGVPQAQQWVSQSFDYVGNLATEGWQSLVGFWNSASLRLTLHTTPPPKLKDGGGQQPMAWVPLVIPANAPAMAFDFIVTGDPVDDVIVCGIGTNNLFSLQAKYVPTNGVSSSRLIDVTAWVGATNELFLGLMGGTSTNCTLQVENIRFYSLQPPRLEIAMAGGTALLTWPAAAGGYVVETSSSLAATNWTVITNAPALTIDRYALTNTWSDQTRFFRLRPR